MGDKKLNHFEHKPHITFVHWIWKSHIQPDAQILDATLGNGYDSVYILKEILPLGIGKLYAIDIQPQALNSANQTLASEQLNAAIINQFEPRLLCHSAIDQISFLKPLDLVIYNLGYLPGFDKSITTLKETTLASIKKAFLLLSKKGMITITFYPGHSEGEKEAILIESFLETLEEKDYQILKMKWVNKKTAPYVVIIQKRD